MSFDFNQVVGRIRLMYDARMRMEDRINCPICICGSSKFKDDIEEFDRLLTMDGFVVLKSPIYTHATGEELTEEQISILHRVHDEKIRQSDTLLIVNKDGYYGSDTAREIEIGRAMGMGIVFVEEGSIETIKDKLKDVKSLDDFIDVAGRCNLEKSLNICIIHLSKHGAVDRIIHDLNSNQVDYNLAIINMDNSFPNDKDIDRIRKADVLIIVPLFSKSFIQALLSMKWVIGENLLTAFVVFDEYKAKAITVNNEPVDMNKITSFQHLLDIDVVPVDIRRNIAVCVYGDATLGNGFSKVMISLLYSGYTVYSAVQCIEEDCKDLEDLMEEDIKKCNVFVCVVDNDNYSGAIQKTSPLYTLAESLGKKIICVNAETGIITTTQLLREKMKDFYKK